MANEVISEDSVPTDLTVSVSQHHSENSENSLLDLVDGKLKDWMKQLHCDLTIHKTALAEKTDALEKLQKETRSEIDLLKNHIQLSSKENEQLRGEIEKCQGRLGQAHNEMVKLQSDKMICEELLAKTKADASEWEDKWKQLNERQTELIVKINRNEFTYDQFERLGQSEAFLRREVDDLTTKSRHLWRQNQSLRKQADQWRNRYVNLRNQYDRQLDDEISKLRQSLQKQMEMVRDCGTESLELRLVEAEQQRAKAVRQMNQLISKNDELKHRMRNEELRSEKKQLELEQSQATNSDLKQRLSSIVSVKSRLERELLETRNRCLEEIDTLQRENLSHQRRSGELQLRLENQSRAAKELQEALIGLSGDGNEAGMSNWPILTKIQSQQTLRLTKRVAQLEAENDILKNQCHVLSQTIHQLKTDLDSTNQLISNLGTKAPETVSLFRDKDAQLRELRSQLNKKDVQLMDSIRQIDRLKRMRNRLANDLTQVLQDRTELETVKRLLVQNGSTLA